MKRLKIILVLVSALIAYASIFSAQATTTVQYPIGYIGIGLSSSSVAPNQTANVIISWHGGVRPYNVTLYSSRTSSCLTNYFASSTRQISGLAGNNTGWLSTPSPPGTYYCGTVTDSVGTSISSSPAYVSVSNVTTSTATTSISTASTSATTSTSSMPTTTITPLSASISVSPSSIIKQPINIFATINWSGGTPPYTARLYMSGSPSCLANPFPAINFAPMTGLNGNSTTFYDTNAYAPGIYFCGTVTDSLGHTAQTSAQYVPVCVYIFNPLLAWICTVTTSTTTSVTTTSTSTTIPATTTISLSALSASVSLSQSSVGLGQSIVATINWNGGTPPYTATLYSSYNRTPVCNRSGSCGYTCTNYISTTPTTGISGTSMSYNSTPLPPKTYFCASVSDSLGHTASTYAAVVLVSNSTSTVLPTTTTICPIGDTCGQSSSSTSIPFTTTICPLGLCSTSSSSTSASTTSICPNGANCSTSSCTNGGTDYPECIFNNVTATCIYGGTYPNSCKNPNSLGNATGSCTNSGTNWPDCTFNSTAQHCVYGGHYPNGCYFGNQPSCSTGGAGGYTGCYCDNGATNPSLCSLNSALQTCIFGGTYPACDNCMAGDTYLSLYKECATPGDELLPWSLGIGYQGPGFYTVNGDSTYMNTQAAFDNYVMCGTLTCGTMTNTTTTPTTTVGVCPYLDNPLLSWLCDVNVTTTVSTVFTTTIGVGSTITTTIGPCANGATNPPYCSNLCTNGATNPPFCSNKCTNGGTNPPYCNIGASCKTNTGRIGVPDSNGKCVVPGDICGQGGNGNPEFIDSSGNCVPQGSSCNGFSGVIDFEGECVAPGAACSDPNTGEIGTIDGSGDCYVTVISCLLINGTQGTLAFNGVCVANP